MKCDNCYGPIVHWGFHPSPLNDGEYSRISRFVINTHCPNPPRVCVMPESDTGWTGWVLLEDTPWMILILWSWVPCAATRGLLLVAGTGLVAQTSHDHTTVSRKEDPQKVDPLQFTKCPKWPWQETTWFGQCVHAMDTKHAFCQEIIKIRFLHSPGQNWPETISSWTI